MNHLDLFHFNSRIRNRPPTNTIAASIVNGAIYESTVEVGAVVPH